MAVLVANPTSQGEIWQGDFGLGSGPLAQNQYPLGQQIYQDPSRFVITNGGTPPPGLGQYATLTCLDADLFPGATNPRCQIQSPFVARVLQTLRFRGWFRLNYTPAVTGSEFFNVMEIYGPPFAASPTISLTIDKFGNIAFASEQQATSPFFFNGMWTTPLVTGVWNHFSILVHFSTDNTIGWVEFSFANDGTDNDVLQSLTIGGTTTTHMPMATLDYSATVQGRQAAMYAQVYRTRGMEASSSVDVAGFRIDTIS